MSFCDLCIHQLTHASTTWFIHPSKLPIHPSSYDVFIHQLIYPSTTLNHLLNDPSIYPTHISIIIKFIIFTKMLCSMRNVTNVNLSSSIHPFFLPTYLYIHHVVIFPSNSWSIRPSTYLPIHPSIHHLPTMQPMIHPFFHLSIHNRVFP